LNVARKGDKTNNMYNLLFNDHFIEVIPNTERLLRKTVNGRGVYLDTYVEERKKKKKKKKIKKINKEKDVLFLSVGYFKKIFFFFFFFFFVADSDAQFVSVSVLC
jgi:hypothetical protein